MGPGPDNLVPLNHDGETELPSMLTSQPPTTAVNPTKQSNSLFSGMSLGQLKQDLTFTEGDDPFGLRLGIARHAQNEPSVMTFDNQLKENNGGSLLLDVKCQKDEPAVNLDVESSNDIDKQTLPEISLSAGEPVRESVLDTILDLSSTEQATLEPVSHSKSASTSNPTQLLGSTTQSEYEKLSIASSVQSSVAPVTSDAKRTSRRDDLLASIDPLSKSTPAQVDKTISVSSSTSINPNTPGGGKHVEDIGKLYPQLSRSQLSGMSAVPLSLSNKSHTKNFAFVETEEDKKEKRTKAGQEDTFGFVHDAMAKAGGAKR